MAEEGGWRGSGEAAEFVGEVGLVVEAAGLGEIGRPLEVSGAIGGDDRLKPHNAGEGFGRQADGVQKTAVEMARAAMDGTGDFVHSNGATGLFDQKDGIGATAAPSGGSVGGFS